MLVDLKAEINRGLGDVAAGRLVEFDLARIIDRGKQLLTQRSDCTKKKLLNPPTNCS